MPKSAKPPKNPRAPVRCFMVTYEDSGTERIWRTEDGKEFRGILPPPGALWYVDYLGPNFEGPDGRTLMAMTPGGSWCIDGQASNCTMREDVGPYASAHRCWCRHGTPPNITVDKQGRTCKAGAGSIKTATYHGFLRNGFFT